MLTTIAIDGISFLPSAVTFVTTHGGHGMLSFAKRGEFWVATGAQASARLGDGEAHEELTFGRWRFPPALPASTFAVARPLPSLPPAL
jgi:hypothetical protein